MDIELDRLQNGISKELKELSVSLNILRGMRFDLELGDHELNVTMKWSVPIIKSEGMLPSGYKTRSETFTVYGFRWIIRDLNDDRAIAMFILGVCESGIRIKIENAINKNREEATSYD